MNITPSVDLFQALSRTSAPPAAAAPQTARAEDAQPERRVTPTAEAASTPREGDDRSSSDGERGSRVDVLA